MILLSDNWSYTIVAPWCYKWTEKRTDGACGGANNIMLSWWGKPRINWVPWIGKVIGIPAWSYSLNIIQGTPPQLHELLRYARSLPFQAEPDYDNMQVINWTSIWIWIWSSLVTRSKSFVEPICGSVPIYCFSFVESQTCIWSTPQSSSLRLQLFDISCTSCHHHLYDWSSISKA